MDDIKVSVCMPTYNHERYIAQAVESVLAQNVNFPIELVIGEDVSTDRTREIVQQLARQHPDRIRLRLSDRNIGGKANFLATIALCRGQYVAMLEGLTERIKGEVGKPVTVVATGGLADLFEKHTRVFDAIEPDLTIQGLSLLYDMTTGNR